MASFTKQATNQLAPAYRQQTTALQAQIPAIQQLYQSLFQGLEAQGQRETQNIFEGASGRGILRSTIPVDAQTTLQEALLQQRGQLGSKMAQEIAGVNEGLAGIAVQRSNAIAQLAQALSQSKLQRQQFGYQKRQGRQQLNLQRRQSAQQLRLQRQLADREYQLQKQSIY